MRGTANTETLWLALLLQLCVCPAPIEPFIRGGVERQKGEGRGTHTTTKSVIDLATQSWGGGGSRPLLRNDTVQ